MLPSQLIGGPEHLELETAGLRRQECAEEEKEDGGSGDGAPMVNSSTNSKGGGDDDDDTSRGGTSNSRPEIIKCLRHWDATGARERRTAVPWAGRMLMSMLMGLELELAIGMLMPTIMQ